MLTVPPSLPPALDTVDLKVITFFFSYLLDFIHYLKKKDLKNNVKNGKETRQEFNIISKML